MALDGITNTYSEWESTIELDDMLCTLGEVEMDMERKAIEAKKTSDEAYSVISSQVFINNMLEHEIDMFRWSRATKIIPIYFIISAEFRRLQLMAKSEWDGSLMEFPDDFNINPYVPAIQYTINWIEGKIEVYDLIITRMMRKIIEIAPSSQRDAHNILGDIEYDLHRRRTKRCMFGMIYEKYIKYTTPIHNHIKIGTDTKRDEKVMHKLRYL